MCIIYWGRININTNTYCSIFTNMHIAICIVQCILHTLVHIDQLQYIYCSIFTNIHIARYQQIATYTVHMYEQQYTHCSILPIINTHTAPYSQIAIHILHQYDVHNISLYSSMLPTTYISYIVAQSEPQPAYQLCLMHININREPVTAYKCWVNRCPTVDLCPSMQHRPIVYHCIPLSSEEAAPRNWKEVQRCVPIWEQ